MRIRNESKYCPIFIVSAARSGSKLLRAMLCASGEFAGYPYDVNYVWKYGSYHVDHDELWPEDVSEPQAGKIKASFDNVCRREGVPRLLEKTVSNSLRVPFVRHIFPDAKIIHLHRSWNAAINSAIACWTEDATSDRIQSTEDRRRKIKEFPLLMAWPYLYHYLKNYGKKKILRLAHVESWGPRYRGIDEDVRRRSLEDVCAFQWARCVENSVSALSRLVEGRDYVNVAYEDLLRRPEIELQRIADFAEIEDVEAMLSYADRRVKPELARPDRYPRPSLSCKGINAVERAERALRKLRGGAVVGEAVAEERYAVPIALADNS